MTAPAHTGSRTTRVLGALALAGFVATTLLGLVVTDPDSPKPLGQGDAVRMLYVHVPPAFLTYVAFGLTFVGSIAWLWKRSAWWDRVAGAAAEVGVLLTALTLATGMLFGRPTWGVYWDWDPRLTTTAILFVVYAGYLLLRQSIVDRNRRARLAAVFGVVGFLNVPIVHFSVLWWRGLHQPPTVIRPGEATIAPVLLAALLASVVSFSLVYLWLLRRRVDLEVARDAAELAMEPAP